MSELALKLIKEAKEKRLTRLDLGNCGLTELPDELFELVWLEELMIGYESRVFNFETLEYIYFESINIGKQNFIKELPEKIKKLKNLKILQLNRTMGISYEKEIPKMPISDISVLENLIELKQLIISNTKVSNLQPLRNLQQLEFLDISDNWVTNFKILETLKNLKGLDLSNQCHKLFNFEKLNKLEYLNIGDTLISDLTPIRFLSNLRRLEAYDTDVSDLKPLKKIIEKGVTVGEGNKFGINISGCPLVNPPMHVVKEGNAAILRYWQELENKETITNNQTKLIFVGNSRAGKTSLWQFLKDKIYNEQADSTHGIKTEIWDSETLGTEDNQNLAAHIWDFGGQEYYHATHRLFLADNAVYVLVWEHDSNKQGTRLEQFKLDDDPNGEIEEAELEHFPASYWLENIQYFAGKHCPVLIVQNKVDEEALKANYTEGGKNLPDCFHLSVKNAFEFQQGHQDLEESNMDFQKFKLRLLKELRKNATAFKLVKYYAQVREALETKAKDTEYIAVSELKHIALQFDETPDLENLLAYLKSFTNTVLYFPQNDVLKDRLYLNPTHISRDIYKILNKQVRENNGKFDMVHIKTRLNLIDDQEAERFVALMREFDLIFEKSRSIKGIIKRQFITPQYLPKKEDLPEELYDLVNTLPFEIGFYIQFKSFVPRSLMLRFIAGNGEFSNQETYWRNGIIYKSPTTQSMIKVEYDHEALTFTICVQDKAKQTIDMQNIVEQFVKLENSNEHIKISNDGKLYVDLRTIRKLQHENSRGDIYENGELIPLSKFDWLTQKIEIHSIMDLKELKNTVHGFIAKAKTKEAMEAVATWAHANNREPLKSDINQLKGELIALDRQETLGLLSFQEVSQEKAKLNNRLLNLMNGIDESSTKDSEGIRVDDTPTPPGTPQVNVSAKLKILMLTANPANTAIINLKKEHSLITLKLQNTQDTFNLILREAVSASEFKEFIETEQPAILHFSGHGEGGKDGGIVVQNDDKNDEELISIDGLDALFEYLKDELNIHIKAVLLNACYSEEQALTIAKYVDYVVGTTVELGDDLAIAFSTGYYFKLATSNLDFELSFKSGRTQAVMKGASKSHFVLYKNGAKSIV